MEAVIWMDTSIFLRHICVSCRTKLAVRSVAVYIYTPHIRPFTCEKKNTYILKVIFTCMCKHTVSSVASGIFLNSLNIKYSLSDVNGNLSVFLDLIVLVKIKAIIELWF